MAGVIPGGLPPSRWIMPQTATPTTPNVSVTTADLEQLYTNIRALIVHLDPDAGCRQAIINHILFRLPNSLVTLIQGHTDAERSLIRTTLPHNHPLTYDHAIFAKQFHKPWIDQVENQATLEWFKFKELQLRSGDTEEIYYHSEPKGVIYFDHYRENTTRPEVAFHSWFCSSQQRLSRPLDFFGS